MSNIRGWRLIALLLVAVVVLAAAWYLISPLFINRAVNEAFPAATSATPMAEATAAMQKAMTETSTKMDEAMPVANSSAAKVVAKGTFYNVVHEGKGQATLYELPDGARIVRLEDFQVLNGPDLHLYLVTVDPVPQSIGSEIPGSIDLGKLKGNIGNQNYDVPASTDWNKIKSIVVWCQPFRVPFIAAKLTAG
jgi:hypothetical protein